MSEKVRSWPCLAQRFYPILLNAPGPARMRSNENLNSRARSSPVLELKISYDTVHRLLVELHRLVFCIHVLF